MEHSLHPTGVLSYLLGSIKMEGNQSPTSAQYHPQKCSVQNMEGVKMRAGG